MLRLALILFAVVLPIPAGFAEAVTPPPFSATYAVHYRGYYAGLLHLELHSQGEDEFVYENRADPSLLTGLFMGRDGFERSVMRIDEKGVRPLSWVMNHGRRGSEGEGALEFSWEDGRVSGTVEGEPVDLPTEPGLQDRLSIQIAVMAALQRGVEPGTIPMIDDDEIKPYSYTRIGSQPLETNGLEIETIVYESTRPGSSRISRVWHAPMLDYIPVRIEQMRKGRVETVMILTTILAK